MSKSAFTDAYASVVAAVRTLRLEKGVSQVELARRLGRPQQFVSYFENGIRRIDLVEFVVIVRALGGDPKELFAVLADAIPMDAGI
jgi:transcriptional regulator with XRE-family HTH domain